ncbi:regulation of mast cell degranulation [Branchiostoma belcheri]|nr:regulation of mast cell degranulation [Branchiostoma belcheri]
MEAWRTSVPYQPHGHYITTHGDYIITRTEAWRTPSCIKLTKGSVTPWSFGVVVYEIATLGNVPYPGLDRQLMEELRGGYREPRPEDCPQEMYDLMLKCWQWEEDDRPEFQQLYDQLDDLMADCSEVSYLEPFGDPDEATAVEAPEGV